jgi:DNA-binding NarL/FixJ family response regulator
MDYLKEFDDIRRELAITRNRLRELEEKIDDFELNTNRGESKAIADYKIAKNILSKREYEVFQLAQKALTDAEIGKQLYLAESTVQSHVRSILKKLDCKRRTQFLQIN